MTVIIFRWMEICPEKWTVHGVPSIFRGIPPSTKNCYSYYLSFNLKHIKTSKIDVANGLAINVANDVLPVWWMEVYPFRFSQSKSPLHAEIKWYLGHESLASQKTFLNVYQFLLGLAYKIKKICSTNRSTYCSGHNLNCIWKVVSQLAGFIH